MARDDPGPRAEDRPAPPAVCRARPTERPRVATPEELAQRQLDAFNAHDLEPFLAVFTDDVEIRSLLTGALVLRGIAAFRERYAAYFAAHPGAHVELGGRLVVGRFAIDQERVATDAGPPTAEALAVYEVEAERIARMWFIEPDEVRSVQPPRRLRADPRHDRVADVGR